LLGGCGGSTSNPGTDSGNGGTDSGHVTPDSGTDAAAGGTDSGTDGGATTTDSAVDADGTALDTGVDASSTTDAGAMGCLFHGRYMATNIRCNGAPYTAAASLMPPAGSWIAADDGTHATFTETIGSCSLIATGHIVCDSPAVGQFTHHPDSPLVCSPSMCLPFMSACSGTAVGAEATWTYTRNADGSIEASTSSPSIRTCTAGATPQGNPLQITWVPMGG
jgi:hypothetical protein